MTKLDMDCVDFTLIELSYGPDTDRLPSFLSSKLYDWVVVTSPEAAAVFLEAWDKAGKPEVRIGVVGGGTGEILEKAGVIPQYTATKATGKTLGHKLPKATGKTLGGELPKIESGNNTVLYPASAKASTDLQDSLAGSGYTVTRLNTYNTVGVTSVSPDLVAEAKDSDIVTFGSPSAVKAWIALEANKKLSVSIGTTSARACDATGLGEGFERFLLVDPVPSLESADMGLLNSPAIKAVTLVAFFLAALSDTRHAEASEFSQAGCPAAETTNFPYEVAEGSSIGGQYCFKLQVCGEAAKHTGSCSGSNLDAVELHAAGIAEYGDELVATLDVGGVALLQATVYHSARRGMVVRFSDLDLSQEELSGADAKLCVRLDGAYMHAKRSAASEASMLSPVKELVTISLFASQASCCSARTLALHLELKSTDSVLTTRTLLQNGGDKKTPPPLPGAPPASPDAPAGPIACASCNSPEACASPSVTTCVAGSLCVISFEGGAVTQMGCASPGRRRPGVLYQGTQWCATNWFERTRDDDACVEDPIAASAAGAVCDFCCTSTLCNNDQTDSPQPATWVSCVPGSACIMTFENGRVSRRGCAAPQGTFLRPGVYYFREAWCPTAWWLDTRFNDACIADPMSATEKEGRCDFCCLDAMCNAASDRAPNEDTCQVCPAGSICFVTFRRLFVIRMGCASYPVVERTELNPEEWCLNNWYNFTRENEDCVADPKEGSRRHECNYCCTAPNCNSNTEWYPDPATWWAPVGNSLEEFPPPLEYDPPPVYESPPPVEYGPPPVDGSPSALQYAPPPILPDLTAPQNTKEEVPSPSKKEKQ
eukprot:gene22765-29933_t